MEALWDWIVGIHDAIYAVMGDTMYYAIIFLAVIALIAQWKLYEKAGQPGVAALVPGWNFIVFLKIVGRPASHFWLFFIPFYGQFYLLPKVWIEVVQSFGKRDTVDYVLVILLNGIYILNMGLNYDTRYRGPVYNQAALPPPHKLAPRSPQMA